MEICLIRLKTPENVGACFRLAMQFNATKIYMLKCVKAGRTNTYKAECHIPIIEINSLDEIDDSELKDQKILLETGGQTRRPWSLLSREYLIAVANEGHGASKEEIKFFDYIYTLNAPNLESYNVSHALAIGLYNLQYD